MALSALLVASYPRLFGFFRVAGLGHQDAEDLAAQTIEALIRNVQGLRRAVTFEAWFWKVARSKLASWLRARRPEPAPPPAPEPAGPAERAEIAEEHQRIRSALERLPPNQRTLLWLREVEGLSYREIGGQIPAAAGTIRVACHRARRALGRAYRELEGQDLTSDLATGD